ncbi:MAG: DMT family transporter [Sphaerochaetaceae bacterium]|nr:DMT family transporter [Sphaerochaetaceae bacterium]
MALAAALSCALSSSLYNRMGERLTSDMIGYVRMFLAVPMGLVMVLVFEGSLPLGYSPQTYLVSFASGFIGFFLCDYYMFKAIVAMGARETSVIMTLNPAITAFLSLFLFSETLTSAQVFGMMITLSGVLLMVLGEKGKNGKENDKELKTGIICAFLGAVLQSVSDVTAKAALSDIPSVSTNMLRLLGGLAAWIVFGFIKRNDLSRQFVTFRDWRYSIMMVFSVILGPVLGVTLTLGAMEMIPAGVVRSLSQTSPVFLIPIDIIRKKKISALSILGTLVSVAGVIILFL